MTPEEDNITRRRRLLDQIDRCLFEGRNISKWEEGFLESIRDKVDIYMALSEREQERLDDIEARKVM